MQLDTSGRLCPIPIIELAKAIRGVSIGTTVQLVSTDPAVDADIRAWCQASGNELASFRAEHGRYLAEVVKRVP